MSGCGNKGLDHQTATRLLQGQQFGSVQGSFSSTPGYVQFTGDNDGFAALGQLSQANVISCQGETCQPGPAADGALQGGGMGGFTYTAGTFVLGEVTGITQPSPTTAAVEARLNFQPSLLYSRFKSALDRLQTGRMVTGFQAATPLSQQTQPRIERIEFQLFDDGWRAQIGGNNAVPFQAVPVQPVPAPSRPTPIASGDFGKVCSDADDARYQGIYQALWNNEIAKASTLLAAPFDVNCFQGGAQANMLASLADHHSPDAIKLLLSKGAKPNISIGRETPLTLAAQAGDAVVVKLLIDAGAKVNVQDGEGHTALSEAQRMGRTDVIKVLVAAGAK